MPETVWSPIFPAVSTHVPVWYWQASCSPTIPSVPTTVLPPPEKSISPIASQEGLIHTEQIREAHLNCGIAVFQRHPPHRVVSAETATRPIPCPTTARFRQAGNSEHFTNRHKKTIHIQTTSLPPRRFFYGENNDEITGKIPA